MKSAIPCSKHKIAFPSWKYVEIVAMAHKGILFNKCKSCNWLVKDNDV